MSLFVQLVCEFDLLGRGNILKQPNAECYEKVSTLELGKISAQKKKTTTIS